jgi:hypothetical protein
MGPAGLGGSALAALVAAAGCAGAVGAGVALEQETISNKADNTRRTINNLLGFIVSPPGMVDQQYALCG